MTIQTKLNLTQYTADNATTVFPITFNYITNSADTDITILLDDATVNPSDYVIAGSGEEKTGSATFSVAPTTGTLTILRTISMDQLLDLLETGDFSAEAIESAYDKLTMICQDITELISRSINIKVKNKGFDTNFPDPTADAYLKITSDGLSLETGLTQSQIVQSSTDSSNSAIAANLSEVAAALSEAQALIYKNNAAVSAAAALLSETNSGDSERNAATSEVNAAASAAAISTVGDVVGTTDIQTITKKTFDDELIQKVITKPTAPPTGYVKTYPKADGKRYMLDSSDTETEIGAGSGGSASPAIAKGSLEVHNGTELVELPVTSTEDGSFLIADSTTPEGLKWSDTLQGTFSPVSDWVVTPCTGSWTTNTTYTCVTRQVGDTLEVAGHISLTGAPNSTTLILDIPNSLIIDSGKITDLIDLQSTLQNSQVTYLQAGIKKSTNSQLEFGDTTTLRPTFDAGDGGRTYISFNNPINFGSGDKIWFNYSVPIQGWSSGLNAVVGNKSLALVIAESNNSEVANSNVDPITFNTVKDDHNIWSGTTLTPKDNGYYSFEGSLNYTTSIVRYFSIYVSRQGGAYAAEKSIIYNEIDNTYNFASGVDLKVGDSAQLRETLNGGTLNPTDAGRFHHLVIRQMSVSPVIAATIEGINSSDLVVVNAEGNNGLSISANTAINFTKVSDTYGAWNGSVFTSPKNGEFTFSVATAFTSALGSNFYVYKNNALYRELSGATIVRRSARSITISLLKDETISFREFATRTLNNDPTIHYLTITQSADSESIIKNLSTQTRRTAYIKDVKANATQGGTFTSGAWRTRDLNTVSGDTELVTLLANQFTLQPGKYEIEATAPAFQVRRHKIKLYNVTSSIDALDTAGNPIIGSAEIAHDSSTIVTSSGFKNSLVLTGVTTFEIHHQCETTGTTQGFGVEAGFGVDEIYTQVKITKVPS